MFAEVDSALAERRASGVRDYRTVAYRSPQHRASFELDADCVPITTITPWALNWQWLDQLARSGTVLLVSPEAAAIGDERRKAIREAFELIVPAAGEARD